MNRSAEVFARLEGLGIPYVLFRHEEGISLERFYQRMTLDFEQTALCKNIFLQNRQGTQHFLVLMRPFVPYRTSVVSKLLGVSRLSFAPPEKLPVYLGTSMGAVSPLGLMFDVGNRVLLAAEDNLLRLPRLLFHPCDSSMTIEMTTRDFRDTFLPACGHHLITLTMPEEES